jgi:hypothetical protein
MLQIYESRNYYPITSKNKGKSMTMNGNAALWKSPRLFLLSLAALFYLLPTALAYAQAAPLAALQGGQAGSVSVNTNANNCPQLSTQEDVSPSITNQEGPPTFKPADIIASFIERYLPVFVPLAIAFLGVIFGAATGRINFKYENIIQCHIDMALGLFSFVLWAFIASNKGSIILLNSDTELKSTRVSALLICDLFLIAISIFLVTQKQFKALKDKAKQAIYDLKELCYSQKSFDENQLNIATEKAIMILDEYPIGIPPHSQMPSNQKQTIESLDDTHNIKLWNIRFRTGTTADLVLLLFSIFFLFLPIMLSTHVQHNDTLLTQHGYRANIAFHHTPSRNNPVPVEQLDSEDVVATDNCAAITEALKRFKIKHPQDYNVTDSAQSVAGIPLTDSQVQATFGPAIKQQ